ncbi:hypothetical protein C8Q80DRAFT_1060960, partial [Daedaleopsis nitida]
DGPSGEQPATYPGVSSLRITALAGDGHRAFAWPLTVCAQAPHGAVRVQDVLAALAESYAQRLWPHEARALSRERWALAVHAYWRRVARGGAPADDGLRRVDYLGDAVCFRGLAPAPDGVGFMLVTGPP